MFDVEIGEEFKIKGGEGKYRFNYDGILHRNEGEIWHYDDDRMLLKLINGNKEIQKFILNKKEKEYLAAVIKPFRDRVIDIVKYGDYIYEYIRIRSRGINGNEDHMYFPIFEKGTMYKRMKLDKKYTLEELGL